MEVNRDEAERALALAQQRWESGDQAAALRLARKSHSLYPTDGSKALVERYAAGGAAPRAAPQAGGSRAGLRSRTRAAESEATDEKAGGQRAYTTEQAQAVRTAMAAKNDYYKLLGVAATATDAELKKAYRKSALMFHPDKNTAPGADEAFKLVAHAFTVLSDGDKRAHYDRFGSDARDTPAGAHAQYARHSPFGGGARFRTMDDEISPEDLFNMFFGGNFGQFNVQFGPNGAFAQQRGARFARAQQQQQQQQQQADRGGGLWSACLQLLPLVLLVVSFFASSLGTLLFGGDTTPTFAFERTAKYASSRTTNARNVAYWVNPGEFTRAAFDRSPSRLWQFERDVEAHYISRLQRLCRQEQDHKRNQVYLAQGWFGFGADRERLAAAEAIPMPACDELRRFR
ncbi:Chaperone protein dnaJ [Coemansia nantahalensis]|uniref:Chaperone protein dnaJ n=2 Tax=Coemansia TaxID=4863 RepID=A0ACC1KSK6_9FUNG|nr:Chaperone protein dnaJ [Coemansia nantahalensis]KAJ2794291.1 Chaperone protein dnaJ [Coemansia helicoidea]